MQKIGYTVLKGSEMMDIMNIDFECTSCKKAKSEASRVPVPRIIEKLDSFFETNDLNGAKRLLDYWQSEARAIGDAEGELSIVNEMLGLTRKMNEKENGERAIQRALELLDVTESDSLISGATVIINAATTSNAFGNPEMAITLYERALEIYESQGLSPDDLRYGALYNNFATTLSNVSRFDEALEYYLMAIENTSAQPTALLDTAISYINLAELYERKDGLESDNIEIYLKMAEEILNSDKVNRDSYYAFVCEKSAPAFDYYGYFFFANELKERARKIYEGN